MDNPKPLTPKDVEEAVSQLRRQRQGITEPSLERIDCYPETIEQGLAKLVLGLIELLRRLLERRRPSAAWRAAPLRTSRWKRWDLR